jgi:ClpP class serine protease
VVLLDELKQGFAQIVISERGDKLKLTREELLEARLFSGIDAVKLGLVDGLGDDSAGLEKAAQLAGVARYDLVDVNIEVARLFAQKAERVFSAYEGAASPAAAGGTAALENALGAAITQHGLSAPGAPGPANLRRLLLPGGAQATGDEPLPGLPLKAGGPNIYYLYVGPSQ